jgi:hypothetical protein
LFVALPPVKPGLKAHPTVRSVQSAIVEGVLQVGFEVLVKVLVVPLGQLALMMTAVPLLAEADVTETGRRPVLASARVDPDASVRPLFEGMLASNMLAMPPHP